MEFVQQNILWVAVAVTSGLMLLWPLFAGGGKGLTPAEATLMINREDAVVVDVRETGEWNEGHIAGARHIAAAQLANRLGELEKFKSRPIILCCASGSRSAAAGAQLKKAGFEKVFNLEGGISAWSGASLPLTRKG